MPAPDPEPSPGPALPGAALVETYLASLTDAAPATTRQRRWALGDLLSHAHTELGEPPTDRQLLDPDLVTGWLSAAATGQRAASLPAQRARASAARALTTYAVAHALVSAGPDPRALRLPAPAPAAVSHPRARALLAATMGVAPWPVPHRVWARFAAHAHLLAVTGAREGELAHLRTADLSPACDAVRTSAGWGDVPDPTRHVLVRWRTERTALVTALQGTDPGALWLRIHPGVNRRTRTIAPAGLAITARGLRLSFTTVTAALVAEDDELAGVRVRDLRALGRLPDVQPPLHR